MEDMAMRNANITEDLYFSQQEFLFIDQNVHFYSVPLRKAIVTIRK